MSEWSSALIVASEKLVADLKEYEIAIEREIVCRGRHLQMIREQRQRFEAKVSEATAKL